jgi:hypothetical protein
MYVQFHDGSGYAFGTATHPTDGEEVWQFTSGSETVYVMSWNLSAIHDTVSYGHGTAPGIPAGNVRVGLHGGRQEFYSLSNPILELPASPQREKFAVLKDGTTVVASFFMGGTHFIAIK